ncbi:DUF1418 family protein [Franconibacter helveticus 513]|uniref:DUF1418 family protein n=1 Tax=Franconibacter helveticus TaxID=357240 RepID=UPI0003FDF8EA|nr:DUF1418 family protein [Franconibacter helveticus]
MRSPVIPRSLLLLEAAGMALLALAFLALNQIVALPAPLDSGTAIVGMIFAGVALMLPATVALVIALARQLAPRLMNASGHSVHQDKEKRDDADH